MSKLLSLSEMCRRVSYYDYCGAYITKKDGTRVRGTLYKLDRILSDDEKKKLTEFGNVRLFVSQYQYAPEIKESCIFLARKAI